MAADPPLTPDIERTLSRYREIQAEERRLKDEKDRLRETLMAHLRDLKGQYWFPVVGGQKLVVSYRRSVQIEYDEQALRRRLGDRYVRILKADPKKIRQHLDEVEPHLEPVLALIGSPHPDRVRAAIQGGVVSKEEFRGAFRKAARRSITVRRAREDEDFLS